MFLTDTQTTANRFTLFSNDEGGKVLATVPREPGEPRSEDPFVSFLEDTSTSPIFSPDGKQVIAVPHFGSPSVHTLTKRGFTCERDLPVSEAKPINHQPRGFDTDPIIEEMERKRTNSLSSKAFSRDGSKFSVVERHGMGSTSVSTLSIWNPKTAVVLGRFGFPQVSLETTAFSPDRNTLALSAREFSYGDDGEVLATETYIYLFDPSKKRVYARLSRPAGFVNSISFSPDGKTAFASSKTGFVHKWPIDQF